MDAAMKVLAVIVSLIFIAASAVALEGVWGTSPNPLECVHGTEDCTVGQESLWGIAPSGGGDGVWDTSVWDTGTWQ